MINLIPLLKRGLLISLVAIMTMSMPLSAWAVEAEECTAPVSTNPGVHQPVGSDASAFTYNCGSGLWESAHYTFNPANGLYTPKDPVVYTYNPSSGKYDSKTWIYNAPTATYIQVTNSVVQPPSGATVIGAPTPSAPAAGTGGSTGISNTGPSSNNTITNSGGVTTGSSINGTGPSSNNTIGGGSTLNGTMNNQTAATLNNQLNALATSGNAMVIGNTTGGSATSGNAQDIANIVNLLQSSSNALNGDTVTFVANIDGDINGDFMLDPNMLGTVQSANGNAQTGNNNLTLNNEVDAAINNDVNLIANSGNAIVANNTQAGDATSGNAQAIANVVNLINSAITSGNSFVGVININGNLNGDILIPPEFIDQLIANNVPTVTINTTGPNSNNAVTSEEGSNNTTVTNTNNLGITNDVNASADSGNASVSGNTQAGNATSGTAGTSITAFNLTGSNVIGRNALLVFVNVMGSWIGMIVNAPPGATTAGLGGGITQNTTGNNSTTATNNTNQRINNNITTAASSGDASVTNNTSAGNARSGNAHSAINLLNVQNSSLSLSDWFGILFINVFGRWNGSFGINTSAGDPISAGGSGAGVTASPAIPGAFAGTGARVFSFIPNTTGNGGSQASASGSFAPAGSDTSLDGTGAGSVNAVLAAATKAPAPQLPSAQANGNNFIRTAAIIGIFTLLTIVADALNNRRKAARPVKA